MTGRVPFGPQPGGGGDDEGDNPGQGPSQGPGQPPGQGGSGGQPDPFAALFGGQNPFAGLFGAGGLPPLAELQQLLSWQGGPVNWELAKRLATQAAGSGDPVISAHERETTSEALRLAELWLDPVTSLPGGLSQVQAWTRATWVETTLPTWATLCDPVAQRVVAAMGPSIGQVLPAEVRAMAAPLMGLLGSVGGAVFGAQVGQAVGTLAREVVGSTDIGFPLAGPGRAALLPANVAAYADGLGVPADEVTLYLALREAAHHRLFVHVPWLRAHLLEAIDAYARGITVDTDAISRALGELDPSALDPARLQEVLGGGLFEPQTTEDQRAALTRLETMLALVEGWVDEVVSAAAGAHLPAAAALRETVRRRRATGGPAEQTFATLVGLELRPRRLREAAALWAALRDARGSDGRDELWAHPDLMPAPSDLDDPGGFPARAAAAAHAHADLDAELAALRDGEPAGGERADSGEPPGKSSGEPRADSGEPPGKSSGEPPGKHPEPPRKPPESPEEQPEPSGEHPPPPGEPPEPPED